MTPSPAKQDHIRQHRRETLLYLIVPLLVTVFIVLLAVAVVLLLERQIQVSLLADWMMTILVFCPALLCTTIVCISLVAAVVLMSRAGHPVLRPFQKVNEVTQMAADRTAKAAETVNNTTVNVASRFAFLDRLLSAFDMPDDNEEAKENHHD